LRLFNLFKKKVSNKDLYSCMCDTLTCCRYDVAAFLSHRLFESGEPVRMPVFLLHFYCISLKLLDGKESDISISILESNILILELYVLPLFPSCLKW